MLRSSLIYLSKAEWARNIVTNWAVAWRTASRFIAGEKIEDAIKVVKSLNENGMFATLDHLGEHTTNPEEAIKATNDILEIFSVIDQSDVRANVSIKLTQIGIALDKDLCEENLRRILEYAQARNNFVRLDMEDSPWVDQTLELYQKMRQNHGFGNIGVVIQSYLFRSEKDIQWLVADCARVRLCKGAYKEPEDVAFPHKRDVDENYDHLAKLLIDGSISACTPEISPDGRIPPLPAIASHDPRRLEFAKNYAKKAGLPASAIEFQMLHGIRRDLQVQLVSEGYPVRIYVPYGTQWYPYFVRRLAERPANLWFFASNLIRR